MNFIWETIILNPIFNVMAILQSLTQNLGLAIILFTIIIKTILIPVTLPQIKMTKKQREIQPELEKIKEKYKHDKQKLAQMQMQLMTKHGINPGAGCITTIITLVLMFAVYRVVNIFALNQSIEEINRHIYFPAFTFGSSADINPNFLYLNLAQPDKFLIIPLITVIFQFLATKMMMPFAEVGEKAAKKTPGKSDDIMQAMMKQNLYVMPVMYFVFGLTLPSGVMLYIIVSTLFQIAQNYYFSGWGGLEPWIKKLIN
jgi:YidC/Oxa1 family membrane protein insertase